MPQSHIQEAYLEEVEFRSGPEWKRYAANKEGLGHLHLASGAARAEIRREALNLN